MAFKLKRNADNPEKPKFDWPAINSLMWVRLPCCEGVVHPTRVENIAGNDLVIATPSKPHLELVAQPDEGRVVMVGWTTGAGSKQVRVNVINAVDGEVPTWTLRPTADVETIQRRQFVRATWDKDVTFHLPLGPVVARIIDVSEGGLRCVVPNDTNEPRGVFQVEFELDESPIVLEAEVAWWGQPTEESTWVGLAFVGQDAGMRDRLRALAYAQQLEERRLR